MSLSRNDITVTPEVFDREWLVTNGIGGFAYGTLSQANTRRYHGILVSSLRPPVDRVVMVAKIEPSLSYHDRKFDLACNEFADGTLSPTGFQHLTRFHLEQGTPVWRYSLAEAILEQRIWMAHGKNTTYVSFTLLHALGPIDLQLKPLCTYRDYHAHSRGGWPLRVEPVTHGCQINAFAAARPYRLLVSGAEFTAHPDWYWHFKHRAESARGLDDVEDLFCPGRFSIRVSPGQSVTLVATAEAEDPLAAPRALEQETTRRTRLLNAVPKDSPAWIQDLTLAADQFMVARQPLAGSNDASSGASVIAGYPWFGDWGRDTMIALPGLTLATGQTALAASVLRTFAQHVSQGMLPNRFPDGGQAPEYNTADATLWYFHAIASYVAATGDRTLLRDLYPTLKEIIEWHLRGTRYRIHVDADDGLLYCGEPGVQLTWMDAKIDHWVVTPRTGKPVEINALWHFALTRMAEWAAGMKDLGAARLYSAQASRVAKAFSATFWYEKGGYLYDVVDGPGDPCDEKGRHVDASLRPNQIFAVSLGGGLLEPARARAVVDVCARELLTPVGLRSLAPSEQHYQGQYRGGPMERDGAYHQGTVWSWLLGPYALAHHLTYGDLEHANALLAGVVPHLADACLGSISEILDGDSPHRPQGCPAQAWSVGEILRAWHLLRSRA